MGRKSQPNRHRVNAQNTMIAGDPEGSVSGATGVARVRPPRLARGALRSSMLWQSTRGGALSPVVRKCGCSGFPVQPHSGSNSLRIVATWAVCQASVCSRASRELADIRSCFSSCFEWNDCERIVRNRREGAFGRDDRPSCAPANMADVPIAGLDWAFEDTQLVFVMLSSASLFGPFPRGP